MRVFGQTSMLKSALRVDWHSGFPLFDDLRKSREWLSFPVRLSRPGKKKRRTHIYKGGDTYCIYRDPFVDVGRRVRTEQWMFVVLEGITKDKREIKWAHIEGYSNLKISELFYCWHEND